MQRFGSMLFCSNCGNLLNYHEEQVRTCSLCGFQDLKNKETNFEVITESASTAFKSTLKSKQGLVIDYQENEGALISEKCTQCGALEMSFHTMQLRSADEGQTVFYTCLKCGYKYSMHS